MPNPDPYADGLAIVEDAFRRWEGMPPVGIEMSRRNAYNLLGGLQLLCQHPDMSLGLLDTWQRLGRAAQEAIADDPELYALCELGWSSEHDVDQDSPANDAHGVEAAMTPDLVMAELHEVLTTPTVDPLGLLASYMRAVAAAMARHDASQPTSSPHTVLFNLGCALDDVAKVLNPLFARVTDDEMFAAELDAYRAGLSTAARGVQMAADSV